LSPWWLRPTAEGAETHEEPSPSKKTEPEPKKTSSEDRADGGDRDRRGRDGQRDRRRPRTRRDGAERSGEESGGDAGKKPAAEKAAAKKPAKASAEKKPAKANEKKPAKAAEDKAPAQQADGGDRSSRRRDRGDGERKPAAESKRSGNGKRERDESGGGRESRREEYTFDEDVSFRDIAQLREEILSAAPSERNQRVSDERKIGLFCDLENIALGVRDSKVKKFDINLVLERLLEKGKIIVKKAYCDWERYSEYKRPFHEAAIEMIDIPQKYYSGKNSADIKMVVDAMDLSYSKEHLDTFVLLSGDSDFSPLVSKLKENNKYVIGIGVKDSSSNLLIDNCDEFIFYEDLWRDLKQAPQVDGTDSKKSEAFRLMVDAIQALLRDNKDVLWGSMIKQTMQRKKPSFNEGYHGYSTFSELLEDAERANLIKLKKDQRSGTYIVTGFAKR